MSKIPCRKCKKCGKYSDIASLICVCGEEIGKIPVELVEISDLSEELIADIDLEIEVFVQKCSACGALNFSLSADEPVKMCCNCHKARIATVVPTKYICDELGKRDDCIEDVLLETSKKTTSVNDVFVPSNDLINAIDDDEDDDEDVASPWLNILGGIRNATGSTTSVRDGQNNLQQSNAIQNSNPIDDDDEDDEDVGNWGNILGGNFEVKESPQVTIGNSELTIIAIRYGQFSYTIKKTDVPLLLGRDATLKDFLSRDLRVSNEHCYINYENNNWIVRDNHSSNGTAVNSKDIGYGGEKVIQNGDFLKLGHHQDSMEFKVLIES